MKSSELAPLLFTVYLAAASGRSPALPCFAAFLALVRFSGLFAFTQLFFQTHFVLDNCLTYGLINDSYVYHSVTVSSAEELEKLIADGNVLLIIEEQAEQE